MARKLIRVGRKATSSLGSKMTKSLPSVVSLASQKLASGKKRTRSNEAGLSIIDRIQAVREQMFKAISVIECCKYASETMLDVESPDYLVGVYDLLFDVLDESAGELGSIAEACHGASNR